MPQLLVKRPTGDVTVKLTKRIAPRRRCRPTGSLVSSPGDVQFERQRVDRVVARLNGELAGAAKFVSVRWETEFYRALDTFQTQIPNSTDCNIVIAIF